MGFSKQEDKSPYQGDTGLKTLGSVTWLINYDDALKKAKAVDKDMVMYVGASLVYILSEDG